MALGLTEFHKYLREFGTLLAAGAPIAATPLIVGFAEMSPPWPKNISFVTAVLQLIVLMLIFQTLSKESRHSVNRVMLISFVLLLLTSFAYLYLLKNFTYDAITDSKGTIERRVKGFTCKPIAQLRYPDICPFLSSSELNEAKNRPEELWTQTSRDNVNLVLVTTWLISFIELTVLFGSFLIFQRRVGVRGQFRDRPPQPKRSRVS